MDENEEFSRDPIELESEQGSESRLPDELISELDRELDGLQLVEDSSEINFTEPETAESTHVMEGLSTDPGIRQMQETFLEISRDALGPVARYMKAISLGENAKELLELSEMVVTPLIHRTEAVGLNVHSEDLSFFRSLLLLALGERDQTGFEAMREVVMEGFSKMSGRFNLSYRGYRLAVRNLVEFYRALKSLDGVSEVDIRRFFAIGVPSLTWVRRTRVSEMTSLSGIPSETMTQIRKIAYEYRSVPPMQSARRAPDDLTTKHNDVGPLEVEGPVDDIFDSSVLDPEIPVQPIRGQA